MQIRLKRAGGTREARTRGARGAGLFNCSRGARCGGAADYGHAALFKIPPPHFHLVLDFGDCGQPNPARSTRAHAPAPEPLPRRSTPHAPRVDPTRTPRMHPTRSPLASWRSKTMAGLCVKRFLSATVAITNAQPPTYAARPVRVPSAGTTGRAASGPQVSRLTSLFCLVISANTHQKVLYATGWPADFHNSSRLVRSKVALVSLGSLHLCRLNHLDRSLPCLLAIKFKGVDIPVRLFPRVHECPALPLGLVVAATSARMEGVVYREVGELDATSGGRSGPADRIHWELASSTHASHDSHDEANVGDHEEGRDPHGLPLSRQVRVEEKEVEDEEQDLPAARLAERA